MTTDLQSILAARPNAVKAIDDPINRGDSPHLYELEPWAAARVVRAYAWDNGYRDDAYIIDIAPLLDAIEAKLKAERPMSDEEIEGLKWEIMSDTEVINHWLKPKDEIAASFIRCVRELEAKHTESIDTLHGQINLWRAKCGEGK